MTVGDLQNYLDYMVRSREVRLDTELRLVANSVSIPLSTHLFSTATVTIPSEFRIDCCDLFDYNERVETDYWHAEDAFRTYGD